MKYKLLAAFVLLFFACAAFAQVNATGVLLGTITDQAGGVVPNADVKIVDKATAASREVKSNGNGLYRFDLLPTGTYTVTVTVSGFATAVYSNVGVAVSQNTEINVTLTPSAQKQVITVEGAGTPLVDTERQDVSIPISTTQLESLPVAGRDFVNLAILAPGAKPQNSYDPTKNRVGVFAVDGSNGRNVNVTVNGIDDKDNTVGGPVMQLPMEAVQEFVISTQRFSAANGRSEGALITAVTKSGSNQLHGSLYLFDRNQAMNATDYFTKSAGNPKPDFGRQQFGGSIGGPIVKEKTFFFFALERQRETTQLAENPTFFNELTLAAGAGLAAKPALTIPTPYFDWRYNARVDHRFNEKNNLALTHTVQNNDGLNDQSTGNSDLTAGNFTKNRLILSSANLNSVLTPSIVNSLTAGYQYWNNLIDSDTKVPTVSFAGGEFFGTNGNVPQESAQRKWQFRDDISITRGKHNFRTGFDFVYEPHLGGFFEFTPTPAISFAADPSQILGNKTLYPQGFATPGLVIGIAETAGNPYFDLSTKMFGLYFQDDWKVTRRLTVNLGVRWDRDFNLVGGSAQGNSRAYQLLKAIGNPYAGIPNDDKKDFSPRVGFAYDLTGKGKQVLRGGFGLYYGQIFQNITLFMIQQANPTVFATTLNLTSAGAGDANADIVPTTGKPLSQWRYGVDPLPVPPPPPTVLPAGATARLIDPSFRNPYSEQFNMGYTWTFAEGQALEVDYVHVLGLHAAKSMQLNPKDPNAGGVRILQNAFTAAKVAAPGSVQMYASIDRSRYDGLNISYRRRMAKRVSLNASYVLSRSMAYNGYAAGFGNTPTDYFNAFAKHDFGPTGNDERHRFTLSGVVQLPWGIQFAPILQAASARPYTAREGTDYFGNGNSSTNQNAILLNSDPTNYTATKSMSAAAIRACLAANSCSISTFGALRGTPIFQLDTRFSKAFTFRERMRLEFFFQAFNLTNRANFGANYGTNIRSGTYGTPLGFFAPSSTQIPVAFQGEAGFTFRF